MDKMMKYRDFSSDAAATAEESGFGSYDTNSMYEAQTF